MSRPRIAVAALFAVALAAPAFAAPVTFPYTNDFSTTVADFNEVTDPQWTLNTTTGVYRNNTSAVDIPSAATLQVNNLGGAPASATSFRVQSTFTVTDIAGAQSTIGFSALGADNDPTNASGAYYLADVQQGGTIRLFEINPNVSLQSAAFAGGALQENVPYTLTLDGVYSGTSLNLALTLSDGTNATTVNFTDATPLTGQFFGFRNRATSAGSVVDVNYDNFTITAVPEPGSVAFLAAGALALTKRRRRA